MNYLLTIISKILPIILLIILGNILKKISFFKSDIIADLKKFILNVSLPSLLFLSFTATTFHPNYLLIILAMFILCNLLLLTGILIKKITGIKNKYFSVLFCCYENGMIGLSLFPSVFGMSNLYEIAIVGLGHIIFIYLILVSYMNKLNGESSNIKQLLLSFVKSPIVLGVFLGSMCSISNIIVPLQNFPLTDSVLNTLKMLGNLTVPLVCITIGYELNLSIKKLSKPLVVVIFRISLNLFIAFMFNKFFIIDVLHLSKTFQIAVYTFFLLPPAFIIPILMDNNSESDDNQFILNTISLHIIFTLITFTILTIIMKP